MTTSNLPDEAPLEVTAAVAEAETRGCACTLFAVVNPNGTLAKGFGAVSSKKLATGEYEVIFNRKVRNCAYVATIGLAGSVGASPSGEIAVVGRASNVNGVFVQTFTSAGVTADRGFHLAVHCRP
ncbi:MAG: hypothetical protein JO115_17305 [Pseudonocardiales bacterium]|nr:hypothetical protein [Pseudonocardiales bacterium]